MRKERQFCPHGCPVDDDVIPDAQPMPSASERRLANAAAEPLTYEAPDLTGWKPFPHPFTIVEKGWHYTETGQLVCPNGIVFETRSVRHTLYVRRTDARLFLDVQTPGGDL